MASFTTKAVLEIVTCAICQDLLNDPRTLSCQHTFCLRCLQGYQNSTEPKRCPTCRQPTVPERELFSDLTPDVNATKLVAFIRKEGWDKLETDSSSPADEGNKNEREENVEVFNKKQSQGTEEILQNISNPDSPSSSQQQGNNSTNPFSFVGLFGNRSLGNSRHDGVRCDNCAAMNFSGPRYKCCICPDYDLCDECHQLTRSYVHDQCHIFLKFKTPEANAYPIVNKFQKAAQNYGNNMNLTEAVHLHTTCDSCNIQPVLSTRYKCTVCKDHDICSTCESRNLHGRNHPMLVLPHPVSSLEHEIELFLRKYPLVSKIKI